MGARLQRLKTNKKTVPSCLDVAVAIEMPRLAHSLPNLPSIRNLSAGRASTDQPQSQVCASLSWQSQSSLSTLMCRSPVGRKRTLQVALCVGRRRASGGPWKRDREGKDMEGFRESQGEGRSGNDGRGGLESCMKRIRPQRSWSVIVRRPLLRCVHCGTCRWAGGSCWSCCLSAAAGVPWASPKPRDPRG